MTQSVPAQAAPQPLSVLLGGTENHTQVKLLAQMANRHGLISGATGTGKTVTLQVLAEAFSRMGVPVFTADVKGDLAGLSSAGVPHQKITERIEKIGIESYSQRGYPTVFWDVFAKLGHPVRTTISEMGPVLLSRLLQLNETQEGVLHIAFRLADDEGLLLLDMKDLRSMLAWVGDNASELRTEYGNISPQSVGAIQRRLLTLEEAGGDLFFGEPALDIAHLMQTDFSGNGVISVLDAQRLLLEPRLYSTFLLWLLSELFEELDEVGDPEKPRLVFFFDEAHLLFKDAPKPLLERIEQVCRLIRSKGVGVYFVTQSPLDVPEIILGQLGNRVQHALRAYTPVAKKAVRTAAETFVQNPAFSCEEVITQLSVGEALVSVLDEKGRPTMVERTLICPPESRMGPLSDAERSDRLSRSPLKGAYDKAVDRESAFELLEKRAKELEEKRALEEPKKKGRQRQGIVETFFKSVARTVGYQIGKQIVRGILGGVLGKRR